MHTAHTYTMQNSACQTFYMSYHNYVNYILETVISHSVGACMLHSGVTNDCSLGEYHKINNKMTFV